MRGSNTLADRIPSVGRSYNFVNSINSDDHFPFGSSKASETIASHPEPGTWIFSRIFYISWSLSFPNVDLL